MFICCKRLPSAGGATGPKITSGYDLHVREGVQYVDCMHPGIYPASIL